MLDRKTGARFMSKNERRRQWRAVVAEQAKSGLTAADFCRDRHIKVSLFYRWRRRLRRTEEHRVSTGFLELTPETAAQSGSGIRIHLANGLSIELERVFDPRTLRRAIETLNGC